MEDAFSTHGNLAPGSRAADIATGTVDLAIAFALACRDGRVSGVDLVSEMLRAGTKRWHGPDFRIASSSSSVGS